MRRLVHGIRHSEEGLWDWTVPPEPKPGMGGGGGGGGGGGVIASICK